MQNRSDYLENRIFTAQGQIGARSTTQCGRFLGREVQHKFKLYPVLQNLFPSLKPLYHKLPERHIEGYDE